VSFIVGNRLSADAAAGWHSMPGIHKSRSELAGPIVVKAEVEQPNDEYYHSVGRQNAMAFNRHAFSGRNARSVIQNQNF